MSKWLGKRKHKQEKSISSLLEEIEKQALQMTPHERAILVDRLLNSFDGIAQPSKIDAAWIKEAEARYAKYKADPNTGIDAATVFAEADNILKPD
jgi:putative addiction module component (TIGR02574 family)